MTHVTDFFANTSDYPDLDEAACVERFASTLRFRTEPGHDSEFAGLSAYLESAWPSVFAAATVDRVGPGGRALCVRVPGKDPALAPWLFLAHQDVVPVVPGTEDDWTHPAYSGFVDEKYVWGRGAIDMKSQLAGMLEAVSYVIEHDGAPARDIYLCFGSDEETTQLGAAAIAELLAGRGVRPELALDEGDYLVANGADLDAPGLHCLNCLVAEKGYVDVGLFASSAGGHSSNPYGGTSLSRLARTIVGIEDFFGSCRLTPPVKAMLETVRPWMADGVLSSAIDAGDDVTAACALASRPETYPLVATTVAPTMIEGSSTQPNVMPQDMRAVVNLRLLQPDTLASSMRAALCIADESEVAVECLPGSNDPGAVSRTDGPAFDKLRATAARYFKDPATGEPLPVVPSISVGATDARNYEAICDACLRLSFFTVDADESKTGVHGTNERIERVSYMQGVRALIHLLALA